MEFPTPTEKPLDQLVKELKADMRKKKADDKRRLLSGPTRKTKPSRPTQEQRPCRSEDGQCDDPCPRAWYARDPYLRDVEMRDVWVCYNAYQRGYRRLCRFQDKVYDSRHVNGRIREAQMALRRAGSAPYWRRY